MYTLVRCDCSWLCVKDPSTKLFAYFRLSEVAQSRLLCHRGKLVITGRVNDLRCSSSQLRKPSFVVIHRSGWLRARIVTGRPHAAVAMLVVAVIVHLDYRLARSHGLPAELRPGIAIRIRLTLVHLDFQFLSRGRKGEAVNALLSHPLVIRLWSRNLAALSTRSSRVTHVRQTDVLQLLQAIVRCRP